MKIVNLEKLLQFTYIFAIIFMMRKKCILLSGAAKIVHQIFTSNYQENLFQSTFNANLSINRAISAFAKKCQICSQESVREWYDENHRMIFIKNTLTNRNLLVITHCANLRWMITQRCFEWPAIKLKYLPVTFLMFYFIRKVNSLWWNSFWGSTLRCLINEYKVY